MQSRGLCERSVGGARRRVGLKENSSVMASYLVSSWSPWWAWEGVGRRISGKAKAKSPLTRRIPLNEYTGSVRNPFQYKN